MTRRTLVLVALTLVCLSFVAGVGSVSSVSTDRSVSVAVADDAEAYLGIEFADADLSDGTETLVITNRASTDLDVTVASQSAHVDPGDQTTFTIDCTAIAEVEITAVGDGVRIDATRSVDCPLAADDGDDDADDGEGDADDGDESEEVEEDEEVEGD